MSERVVVKRTDGKVDEYESTIFTNYRKREASDGTCITKETFFQPEHVVKCYPKSLVKEATEVRCLPCEAVNPIQRPKP